MRFRTASKASLRFTTALLLISVFAAAFWFIRGVRASAVTFSPGSVVVYRVGSGTGSLVNTGNPVFLDEYDGSTGNLIQSIPLPTATSGSNKPLIASGTATSEGLMTLSADGKYLVLTGYGTTTGGSASLAGTSSTSVPRTVGRVDANGNIDTSTALTDFATGNNPRAAASSNGTDLWVGGAAGGVRYATLGATTSTQLSTTVTNIRSVEIFAGQLYNSDSSGSAIRIGTVGSGLPTTSGQTITNLPGFATNAGSPYAFFLADLDPNTPGVDTLYAADDGASGGSGVGLAKYCLIGGNWVSKGTIGVAADNYRGLTGAVSGSNVTLFAVRNGGSGATGGGDLVTITDSSGFGGTLSGTPTRLVTAAANTAFRGVAMSPQGTVTVIAPNFTKQPASVTINSGQSSTLTATASGTAPITYQWYLGNSGDSSSLIPGATGTSYTTPALTSTTNYWVRATNSAGHADSNTATVTVVTAPPACTTAYIPINKVQGAGETSSFYNPQAPQQVSIRGVVVGDYEGASPTLRGFYLQDLAADYDADPATSEGIFVFESNNADTVSLGQVVQVTGTVNEFQGQTEIDSPVIESCGTTASVTPTDVTLPVPAAVNGVAYLERYEGMLVRFHQTLFVTEMFQLGQFGQVVMSANGKLPQPTAIVPPGTQAQTVQAANNLNQIIVDDDLQNQDPDPIKFGRGGNPLTAANTLRGGDTATDIVGVMTFTWSGFSSSGNAYRLRPISALGGGTAGSANPGVPAFQATDPRPTAAPNVNGRLKIVGMNVLNYFLTLDDGTSKCGPIGSKQQCRGAETGQELSRQQAKLNAALLKMDADVIGMSELENTQDSQGNDVNPLADIVNRLNSSLNANVYSYINTGIVGTDDIRVGIVYKPAKVTPVGTFMADPNPIHNRPPIAQLFAENSGGERFTLVVNHFRSKGCSSGSSTADQDQNDGQGCFNSTRTKQAQALVSFINGTVVPAVQDPDILLVGDFNSYAKEDPIRALEQAGFTDVAARYNGTNAYSYVFSAQWGYIDYGLASTSLLAQTGGAADYHVNSDEPSALDYNVVNSGVVIKDANQIVTLYNADEFRYSDHDPILIGLNLTAAPVATADAYNAEAGTTLTVNSTGGILANDSGGPLSIIGQTSTSHGTLALNSDGSFSYTPAAGYVGPDSFSYTISNGVLLQLYSTNLPPLATIGGVNITAGGYGSALTPVPRSVNEFYGLTDRGPNVDGPNGTKVEPLPSFTPAIGKFLLSGTQAILEQTIPLMAADGTPYSGRVNSQANTGETILDLNGNVLATDPNGYDSEGLVALADGTFWVSDEYGPFITHFDASGKQIGRYSPFDGSLPAELSNRLANRGMEGLTITPDGSTLVGAMQSALDQPDLNGFDPKKLTPLRIVTVRLADGAVHEYLYLLDNPASTKTAVSEITALSNTTFLVDERDGNFPPGSYKKIFKSDISGATDVGPASTVPGAVYQGNQGGLKVLGKTLDALLMNQDTATSTATLASNGISPVTKSLYADIDGLITKVDPQGRFFSHDKMEGVAVLNNGATLVVSNDSDFGIDGVTNSAPPFQLHAKVSPSTGLQDDGEFLWIDSIRSTANVTFNVVDTTAPKTMIFSEPSNPSSVGDATFTFGGTDTGSGIARFECSLDGTAFATCVSGIGYSGLAPGNHTFTVQAIDNVGNVDPEPPVYGWVYRATPILNWTAPAAITFGSALGSGQLNANSNVPGTFVYTPAAGTVLPVGNNQTLSVKFTPTDSVSYTTATATTTITVNAAPPPASGVNLVTTKVLSRNSGNVVVTITISNNGGTNATNVKINTVTVGGTTATPLPQLLGTVAAGTSVQAIVSVPGSVGGSGAASSFTLSGTYDGGTFSSAGRITLP